MSYIYTVNDIAFFLNFANFKLSDELFVLDELWAEQKHIDKRYWNNKALFKKDVWQELSIFTSRNDVDEIDSIMRDIDPEYILSSSEYEQNAILHFFKIVQLELLYIEGRKVIKIKLRKLLKYFGYKRRSQTLIENIVLTMNLLSLTPYLRGNVPCDIATADLDVMIMIRLKN